MTTVVVVDEAERQLREIVAWWIEHRLAAPMLALDEFEATAALLRSSPDVGREFRRTSVPGVRRLLLPRSRHYLYYVHDAAHAVVYIIAIWGAPKDGDPVLHDPRR